MSDVNSNRSRSSVPGSPRASQWLRNSSSVWPFAAVFVFFTIFGGGFLRPENLSLIADTSGFIALVAVGQTFLIIGGEFDLSVGGVAAIAGFIASNQAATHHWPAAAAVLVAVVIGLGVGALNGVLVVLAKIPSFIATIGTLYITQGIVTAMSHGTDDTNSLTGSLSSIGIWSFHGYNVFVFIALGVALGGEFVLRRTLFGRRLFATGSNIEAARIVGIRTGGVRLVTFVCVGGLAGLAGLFSDMSLGVGDPTVGGTWTLLSVGGVVIGGASLTGGSGSALGTVLGVLTLEMIANGVELLGLNSNWDTVLTGGLMIIIVALHAGRKVVAVRTAARVATQPGIA